MVGYVGRRELEATLGNIYKKTQMKLQREKKEKEKERTKDIYIYIWRERKISHLMALFIPFRPCTTSKPGNKRPDAMLLP